MDDATITLVVLAVAVVLFVANRLPVEVVAVGAALTLYATGVISVDQAFAGFGDVTVIFIASLFVVSESLDATGITTWAGQKLVEVARNRDGRLIAMLLVLVAVLSALITVNGAVAALIPLTVVTAIRMSRTPARLLMPLAYVAHAGSLLALTGTPVNVLVADAAENAGAGRFGYFEFALVGVPLVLGGLAIALVLAPRVLPERRARSMPADLSAHARTLVDQYDLRPGDGTHHEVADSLFTRRSGVAEVVVPPRSELTGDTVFPGMVTESGDLVVLAIQRQGEDVGPRPTQIQTGDTLLLQGTWTALDEHLDDPAVLVVESPDAIRRQTVALGAGARRAAVVMAAMVALLVTGAVPAAVAGALAALALVILRVLSTEQAYRAVNWTTIVLIAGMIPVSTAIQSTGAADDIARVLVDAVGGLGPHVLLIGLFLITAALGQAISNTATALVVIPIAVSAAVELHVSPRPVLMSVAVPRRHRSSPRSPPRRT